LGVVGTSLLASEDEGDVELKWFASCSLARRLVRWRFGTCMLQQEFGRSSSASPPNIMIRGVQY
jgi:hypothetical protein